MTTSLSAVTVAQSGGMKDSSAIVEEVMDVRTIRHQLDLTQTQLGDRLDVSRRTIGRWEHGAPVHPVWQERITKVWRKQWPRKPLPMTVLEP